MLSIITGTIRGSAKPGKSRTCSPQCCNPSTEPFFLMQVNRIILHSARNLPSPPVPLFDGRYTPSKPVLLPRSWPSLPSEYTQAHLTCLLAFGLRQSLAASTRRIKTYDTRGSLHCHPPTHIQSSRFLRHAMKFGRSCKLCWVISMTLAVRI